MSNLTQQIAGAYIGAQVEWTNKKWDIYSYGKDGVQINALVVPYDQCRLILTPLSAISDEDAVEVSRIYGHNQPTALQGRGILEMCMFDYEEPNEVTLHDGIRVADYLRSDKRPDGTPKPVYDLGYMGIRSLIDAGIAISSLDKTDSNVQP